MATKEQLIAKATKLREQGLSYREIGEKMTAEGFKGTHGGNLKLWAIHNLLKGKKQMPRRKTAAAAAAPVVSYQRIPPLPPVPTSDLVMVIIARPEEIQAIAKGLQP
jgi:hypothetical protein